MNTDALSPVSDRILEHLKVLPSQALGHKISVHSPSNFPEIKAKSIALIGVLENRNTIDFLGEDVDLDPIRFAFYSLFPGNWTIPLYDLGDLDKGDTVKDTYFALTTLLNALLLKEVLPVVLGGGQDLVYIMYRAFDGILPIINMVNVDYKFNLGDSAQPIKNNSFVGRAIVEEPYNLFNYSTIGYQTYYNSQEEIDLMEKLYFEAYRLGEIQENIKIVEPVMRDANLVAIDMSAVKASEVGIQQSQLPNGFTGQEICAISRYAGISNKVSAFGIFEYKASEGGLSSALISQMLWYFIEGVNFRIEDDVFTDTNTFTKYSTLTDAETLTFFKSNVSGRWWVEIPFMERVNNKLKKHTLLACSQEDYLNALNNIVPERWYKASRKNFH